MVSIEANCADRIEEILCDHVSPVAKEMVEVWLDVEKGEVGVEERGELERRDRVIRNKLIENDLGSSYPRLFGQEVADRVLRVLQADVFNA